MKAPGTRSLLIVTIASSVGAGAVFLLLAVLALGAAGKPSVLALATAVAAISVFVIWGASAMLIRRVARPVERILDAAEALQGSAPGHLPLLGDSGHGLDQAALAFERAAAALIEERARLAAKVDEMTRVNQALAEARESLFRSEKLATVGRLAAGVAHEVGNPLGAISGYTSLARSRLSATADPDLREALDRIAAAADRIDHTVRGLLDFARPAPLELRPVTVAAAIDAAMDLARVQPRCRSVEVVVTLPRGLPLVLADERQLCQVFVNLLLNAGDAMEGKGRVEVGGRVESGTMEITMLDSGPGIAPQNLAQLFDPFFTTKDPGAGSGLGLAISHSIIESFGGSIDVANSERGGAVFTLRLRVGERVNVSWATPRSKVGEPFAMNWEATLAFVFVMAVAAWVRIAYFGEALAGGEMIPIGGDGHYHLRRIEGALRGAIPTFDPLMNWPVGGVAPWADGFDLLGAAFATIAGGGANRAETRVAIFLWPVVIGILAVWATIDLARMLVPRQDRWTPLAAGLIAAFIPQFVAVSSFGFLDHHIAEALSMVLLADWCVRRFSEAGEGAPGIAWEAAGAGAVALALWVFSGGVLYVALVAVPLGLSALGPDRTPRLIGSGAPALVAGALLGAASTIPALLVHGRLLSFAVPSLLQPCVVAVAGMALGAAVLASRRLSGRSPAQHAAFTLAVAASVVAIAMLLVPSLLLEIRTAIGGWVFRHDPWIDTISEFQPLLTFRAAGRVGDGNVQTYLGPVGVMGAVVFPISVVVAWRTSPRRAMTFAFLTAVLAALALMQVRFTRLAAPMLAIVVALAFRGMALQVSRLPRVGRAAAVVPLLGAMVIVLGSSTLRSQLAMTEPRDLLSLYSASLELKLDREPIHGHREGVLAPWDVGHFVMYLSGRPVAANGFGSYLDPVSFRDVQEAFLGDEKRLVETMEKYDLGYVVGGGLSFPTIKRCPKASPPSWEPLRFSTRGS